MIWPLALLWICWAAYWAIAAIGNGPVERAEPRGSRIAHIVLVGFSFVLLFSDPLHVAVLDGAVFPEGSSPYVLGLFLTALGLGFAVWARIELGRNWSGVVAIRSEQCLVQSGPYALVRHPIYSGLLAAFVGSAIAIGKLGAALAAAIALCAYWRKIRIEEGWLLSAFGQEYESYRRHVGALLPFRRAWTAIRDIAARSREHLLSAAELDRTIERLCAGGQLPADGARRFREDLPHVIAEASYVLRHLGAHLTIGVVFAFDLIPLPLGTIGRVLWVVGNRIYESAFGTPERARVHSLAVLLVAAIPWVGYAAYLLPLRRTSLEVAWLFAQHVTYRLYGTPFEEFVAGKPHIIRKVGTWLIPPLSEHTAHLESAQQSTAADSPVQSERSCSPNRTP